MHDIRRLGASDNAEDDGNDSNGSCCFEDQRVEGLAGFAFNGVVPVAVSLALRVKNGGRVLRLTL